MDLIGRLHPLIIHLPIGILVLGMLMELAIRFAQKETLKSSLPFIWGVGAISSIIAVLTGLNLANMGDYDQALLSRHQWSAIALACMSVWVWWQHRRSVKTKLNSKLYLYSLIGVGVLLGMTGHFGGSMTHGSDFLFVGKSSAESVQIENIEEALAFEEIIAPILTAKCNGCHNPSKAKGDLIMTTQDGIVNGGKEGAVLLAGKSTKSPMITRLHLPLEEKEHMPPKGKKQLSKDEVALLTWWIDSGASFDKQISALEVPEAISIILKKYQQPKSSYASLNVKPASANQVNNLLGKGIKVNTLGSANPWLTVNLSYRQDISSSLLRHLNKVSNQISELELANTNVDDDMLSGIGKFKHLRKLKLQNTSITDKSISRLTALDHLESLNLYGSNVTDDIVDELKEMKQLKNLYVWQTKLTSEGIEELKNSKPKLNIEYQLDTDLFGEAILREPLITSENDIFKDSLLVSLEMNFKNVNIHYTADGSTPDSLSAVYTEPFSIGATSLVKAISRKQGWDPSGIAERQFIRASIVPDKIVVSPQPHEKYRAEGAASLTDFKKGTVQFTDGAWLGYENKHLTTTMTLNHETDVKGVTVSALRSAGAYIHYPKQITVSLSSNGKTYQKVGQLDIPVATESTPPELKNFFVEIEARTAKYIKVDIKSQLVNPDWHPAPGAPCWMFIDEILVEG